jgi:hypothetical protein
MVLNSVNPVDLLLNRGPGFAHPAEQGWDRWMRVNSMKRRPWAMVVVALIFFISNYVLVPVFANLMGDPGSDAAAAAALTILIIIYAFSQLTKDEQTLAQVPLGILVKALLQKIPDQAPPKLVTSCKICQGRKICQTCKGKKIMGRSAITCPSCGGSGVNLATNSTCSTCSTQADPTWHGWVYCPDCTDGLCSHCHGSGLEPQG